MSFSRKDFVAWALVGEGGEAHVFRARQRSTRRVVAIRELKPEAAMRAAHEAELLANLRHQGLAVLIDYGFDQGRFHLVQDYVQGALPQDFGPLPALAAVRCLRNLAKTLAFLHSRGVVHGDLNPGNLLLTGAEECVLVDFGMVRRRGEVSPVAMGAPRYFTPEHFNGAAFEPATDVFACGSLLYFLVTGKHLFMEGDYPSLEASIQGLESLEHAKKLALRWEELPAPLWNVLQGCIRFEMGDRFEDMEELDENLEIAEQALRKSSPDQELLHTQGAIKRAILARERFILDQAFQKAEQDRDWKNAEILLDDLLAIAPSEPKYHAHLRFLVQKKKRKKKGLLLMGIGFLMVVSAIVLRCVFDIGSQPSPLQTFGQQILKQERLSQPGFSQGLPKATQNFRLVHVDQASGYAKVWIDSQPIALDDEFVRLTPGLHVFRGLLQGELKPLEAKIFVPAEGEIRWQWKIPPSKMNLIKDE